MPNCLLSSDLIHDWTNLYFVENREEKIEKIKYICDRLPDAHFTLLKLLLGVLHNISRFSHNNQMSALNLALCICPSILWSSSISIVSPISSQQIPAVLQFMIENCIEIFGRNCLLLLQNFIEQNLSQQLNLMAAASSLNRVCKNKEVCPKVIPQRKHYRMDDIQDTKRNKVKTSNIYSNSEDISPFQRSNRRELEIYKRITYRSSFSKSTNNKPLTQSMSLRADSRQTYSPSLAMDFKNPVALDRTPVLSDQASQYNSSNVPNIPLDDRRLKSGELTKRKNVKRSQSMKVGYNQNYEVGQKSVSNKITANLKRSETFYYPENKENKCPMCLVKRNRSFCSNCSKSTHSNMYSVNAPQNPPNLHDLNRSVRYKTFQKGIDECDYSPPTYEEATRAPPLTPVEENFNNKARNNRFDFNNSSFIENRIRSNRDARENTAPTLPPRNNPYQSPPPIPPKSEDVMHTFNMLGNI